MEGLYPDGPLCALFGTNNPLAVLLLVVVAAYLARQVTRCGSSSSDGARRPPGARTSLLEVLSLLVVGVLARFFAGFGIQAFYPTPELPEERFGPPEPPPGGSGRQGEGQSREGGERTHLQGLPRGSRGVQPLRLPRSGWDRRSDLRGGSPLETY